MDIEPLAPMSNPRFLKKDEINILYTPSPTLRLMTQYGEIFKSIDNLFEKIKKLTHMDEFDEQLDNTSNLKKMSYRIYAFRQIKQEANFTLQQLAKLHSFIANVCTISYLEYAGKLTKEIMDAWDKFFFGISVMERKRNKRLKIFHDLATETTQKCSQLLKAVKQKLYVKLITCVLKSNNEFKNSIHKCRNVFKLDSLRFENRFLKCDVQKSSSNGYKDNCKSQEDQIQSCCTTNWSRQLSDSGRGKKRKRNEFKECERTKKVQVKANQSLRNTCSYGFNPESKKRKLPADITLCNRGLLSMKRTYYELKSPNAIASEQGSKKRKREDYEDEVDLPMQHTSIQKKMKMPMKCDKIIQGHSDLFLPSTRNKSSLPQQHTGIPKKMKMPMKCDKITRENSGLVLPSMRNESSLHCGVENPRRGKDRIVLQSIKETKSLFV